MSEWISVEQKLPDQGVFVLAYDRCEKTAVVASRGLETKSLCALPWFVWGSTHRLPRVTHWCPLPEPPVKNGGPF